MLLPSNQALPSQTYISAIQRALRMSQSRLIPFFGIFLRFVNTKRSVYGTSMWIVRSKYNKSKRSRSNHAKICFAGICTPSSTIYQTLSWSDTKEIRRNWRYDRSFSLIVRTCFAHIFPIAPALVSSFWIYLPQQIINLLPDRWL